MAKRPKTELDGYPFPIPDNYPETRRMEAKRESLALPSLVMVTAIAFAWMMIAEVKVPASIRETLGLEANPQDVSSKSESFRQAVNKAMRAAELTQTARYREEWQKVSGFWQEAIELMRLVPDTNAKYAIAQAKVKEYGRNLEYSQSNVRTRPTGAPINQQLWGKGSTRAFLLAVQGLPTEIERNDRLCKEIYRYGNSEVELDYGIVSNHKNTDNNLNATPTSESSIPAVAPPGSPDVWSLGATKQTVLSIQGTPSRVKRYDTLAMDILYYNGSTVQLRDGIVAGYTNFDGVLLIDIDSMVPNLGFQAVPSVSEISPESNAWSIGSARADVFRVQGTPTKVSRSNLGCQETLYYESSTVKLNNGIVREYNNLSDNLKVSLTNIPPI